METLNFDLHVDDVMVVSDLHNTGYRLNIKGLHWQVLLDLAGAVALSPARGQSSDAEPGGIQWWQMLCIH